MLDLTTLDKSIAGRVEAIVGAKSTVTGRIRAEVPTTQMPSLDVSARDPEEYIATSTKTIYKVPVDVVISVYGHARDDAAAAFKALIASIIDAVSTNPEGYMAITDTKTVTDEGTSGTGIIRSGRVTFTVLVCS